jgi:hypothetical protein
MAVKTRVKSFITLAMVANFTTTVIYRNILALENVGTTVNYRGIFITLAHGITGVLEY